MLRVPLTATPSQTLNIVLAGQACRVSVYQKFFGLFLDLFVSDQPIIHGVLCLDRNYIVRSLYLGFAGDLAFFDTFRGSLPPSDPNFTGLGGRFALIYLEKVDLPLTYGLSR